MGEPGQPGEELATAPDGVMAEFERLRRRLGFTDEPAPRVDGRYRVERTLGRGAMGEVHLAHDHRLGRTVALKVVHAGGTSDTATLRARLEREAQALARVDHPNVVGIFDVGTHEGQTYFTMQYVAGTTLRAWQGGRPCGEIVAAYLQAARGLAAAHAVEVVHRDFKPKSECPPQSLPLPPSGRILADRGDLRGGGVPRHGASCRSFGNRLATPGAISNVALTSTTECGAGPRLTVDYPMLDRRG